MQVRRLWMIAALLMVLLAPVTIAQVDRATLSGVVRDASGTPVAEAKVVATADGTGTRRQVQTTAQGTYSMSGLAVGMYTIEVSHGGFDTKKIESLTLSVGQSRGLDVVLQASAQEGGSKSDNSDTLEVRSGGTLNGSTAEVGSVIEASEIHSMPLNGRHWAGLMALAPLALNASDGTQNTIRFAGRGRDDNNWTLDGIDATGIRGARQNESLRLVISSDSIAEFRVNSALYSAESGTGAGAQVNLVTRSGTNELHGALYEYLRNNALDARGPFDGAAPPPFRLNQFGANMGGPIVRNRAFYFANYEGLRQVQNQTLIGFVPSAAFRNRVSTKAPELFPLLQSLPTGRPTADPDAEQYTAVRRQSWREDSFMGRADYTMNDRTTLFARFNMDTAALAQPANVLESATRDIRPMNAVVQVFRVISANVVNEIKAGVNRYTLLAKKQGPTDYRFIWSFVPVDGRGDANEAGTSYSVVDNLVVARGRNTFKFGGEMRRVWLNFSAASVKTLFYADRASLEANKASWAIFSDEMTMRGMRRNFFTAFAQDDVRLRSNLNLNIGARYEYYSVPTEVNGRARVIDVDGCKGICAPGTSFYMPRRLNVDPRVGIVWAPGLLRGRGVIRAGYGLYHGPGRNDGVTGPILASVSNVVVPAFLLPKLGYPADDLWARASTFPQSPPALQRDRHDPYSQQWGLTMQYALPKDFVLSTGYLGSNAHQLPASVYVLAPIGAPYGTFQKQGSFGNSSFQAMQTSIRRTLTRGWMWQAAYVWSHSISDVTVGPGEPSLAQDVNCRQCERASSNFDARHALTVSSHYKLPFGRGQKFASQSRLWNAVAGGWELSGFASSRTALPVNITIDRAASEVLDTYTVSQRPDLVPSESIYPAAGSTPTQWLNPKAFRKPGFNMRGNTPRNVARGPGMWQIDTAVQKSAWSGERASVNFRAEAFNVLNHTLYGNPASVVSSAASFGRITAPLNTGATGTGTSRRLQMMLRISF